MKRVTLNSPIQEITFLSEIDCERKFYGLEIPGEDKYILVRKIFSGEYDFLTKKELSHFPDDVFKKDNLIEELKENIEEGHSLFEFDTPEEQLKWLIS